jgi:hypothetical protein
MNMGMGSRAHTKTSRRPILPQTPLLIAATMGGLMMGPIIPPPIRRRNNGAHE